MIDWESIINSIHYSSNFNKNKYIYTYTLIYNHCNKINSIKEKEERCNKIYISYTKIINILKGIIYKYEYDSNNILEKINNYINIKNELFLIGNLFEFYSKSCLIQINEKCITIFCANEFLNIFKHNDFLEISYYLLEKLNYFRNSLSDNFHLKNTFIKFIQILIDLDKYSDQKLFEKFYDLIIKYSCVFLKNKISFINTLDDLFDYYKIFVKRDSILLKSLNIETYNINNILKSYQNIIFTEKNVINYFNLILGNNKLDNIELFYNNITSTNTLIILSNITNNYLVEKLTNCDNIPLILEIISFYKSIKFNNNKIFNNKTEQCIKNIINKNFNDNHYKEINDFINKNIIDSLKNNLIQPLDTNMTYLLKFLNNDTLFIKYFKINLCRRLLKNTINYDRNYNLEKENITIVNKIYGNNYSLDKILEDYKYSGKITDNFKKYNKNISIYIVNNFHWSIRLNECKVPIILKDDYRNITHMFNSNYKNKILKWNSLSYGIVTTNYLDNNYDIEIDNNGLLILELLDLNNYINIQKIVDNTKLDINYIKKFLKLLCKKKFIRKKEDDFILNKKFSSPINKLNFKFINKKKNKRKHDNDDFILQCLLVKQLKTDKKLTYQNLIQKMEGKNVNVNNIMLCLDILINKEYVKYIDNTYIYVP